MSSQGLTYKLSAEVQVLKEDLHRSSGGRAAKTLAKAGNLRVALIIVRSGTVLDPHATAGGASLQVLEGRLRVSLDEETRDLGFGDLMVFSENVHEPVEALEDTALLLTVAWPDGAGAWDLEAAGGHLA